MRTKATAELVGVQAYVSDISASAICTFKKLAVAGLEGDEPDASKAVVKRLLKPTMELTRPPGLGSAKLRVCVPSTEPCQVLD